MLHRVSSWNSFSMLSRLCIPKIGSRSYTCSTDMLSCLHFTLAFFSTITRELSLLLHCSTSLQERARTCPSWSGSKSTRSQSKAAILTRNTASTAMAGVPAQWFQYARRRLCSCPRCNALKQR